MSGQAVRALSFNELNKKHACAQSDSKLPTLSQSAEWQWPMIGRRHAELGIPLTVFGGCIACDNISCKKDS